MNLQPALRLILSPWLLHVVCCAVALLCCLPILFLPAGGEEWQGVVVNHAGAALAAAFLLSAAAAALSFFVQLSRLRNGRAFAQLALWVGAWGVAALLFIGLAVLANLPPLPEEGDADPIQISDTLYPAHDPLNGPSSLVIPISPEQFAADRIVDIPALSLLESQHEEILDAYLTASPRWAVTKDNAFYSKPGHVVMVMPGTGGTPSLVHAAFRRLVDGDQLPKGYAVVQPGKPFPTPAEGGLPDLALELGGQHYLLLAWRGTAHAETAARALNAAIAAIDERFQPLADTPTLEQVGRMLTGKRNITGSTPEFRLSEPPAQYGAYQAEIYANPGEPGTLLLYIKELESGKTLRLINCPAFYSDRQDELFRHDIPGSVPLWMRQKDFNQHLDSFPETTPLFAIKQGKSHRHFGVACEVRFSPANPQSPPRMLLRRCYKVEAYDKDAGHPASLPEKNEAEAGEQAQGNDTEDAVSP